jgi:ribosomal protein S27AE
LFLPGIEFEFYRISSLKKKIKRKKNQICDLCGGSVTAGKGNKIQEN